MLRHVTSTTTDPAVLVGLDSPDDAAVYRLTDEIAMVQTVDFFTPIVDDPFDWGRIAAANALSDVYAMGGRPVTALNLVGWPRELDFELLGRVLEGGSAVCAEAELGPRRTPTRANMMAARIPMGSSLLRTASQSPPM